MDAKELQLVSILLNLLKLIRENERLTLALEARLTALENRPLLNITPSDN